MNFGSIMHMPKGSINSYHGIQTRNSRQKDIVEEQSMITNHIVSKPNATMSNRMDPDMMSRVLNPNPVPVEYNLKHLQSKPPTRSSSKLNNET
jgi:hypothetical protein